MSDNPLMTPPLEETVPLYSGEDQKRLDEFEDQIERLLDEDDTAPAGAKRMGKPAPKSPVDRAREVATKRDQFRADAEARSPKVVLRGIGFIARDALLDEHPPRDGKPRDRAKGYNGDTFPPALVRACMVSPEVTDEQWAEFFASASAGRFERLFTAAQRVTQMDVDLPKSSAVSALDQLLGQK